VEVKYRSKGVHGGWYGGLWLVVCYVGITDKCVSQKKNSNI